MRYRIVFSIVVIEVVMLSILVWANTSGVRQTHADRLAQSADLILDQFTATVGRYIVEADYASLEEYAQSVLNHGELRYITIVDATGKDVLSIGSIPAAQQLDETPADSSDDVYDVSDPILFGDRIRGRVDMGFSLEVMERTIQEALRRGATIATVGVMVSVVAALVIGYGLTTNLASLSNAVERFRRGRANVSVPVRSHDEVGQLASAFNSMVRDREKAEATLRLNEGRLRQATELAGLGYWIWDSAVDGCVHCSKEHAEILGRTVDDIASRGCGSSEYLEIVHPDDRTRVEHAFKSLRTGTGFEMEYRIVLPSGAIRHIEEIAKSIFDENGSAMRAYGASRDITELKRSEEQLRQAQKMETVGQLTGGIAHDFNNLLAISMGNLELLREDLELQPDALKFVDTALSALDRGRVLTHRLLAFSRRQPLLPEVVGLNALVTGMVELLERTLGETIEIETILAQDVWPAFVDRSQVETVLLNLAVNARDAMPDGGRLTLETDRWHFDGFDAGGFGGDCAMIAVHDTGTGMTPEQVERAFEPFFTTKDVGKGTGLGLSMVFGFARQSGGDVRIESSPGRGTTVRLYLPRAMHGADERLPPPDLRPVSRGEGEHILVVEDDPDVRHLVVALLEDQGYRVSEAGDGTSALQLLKSDARFDLLFTDLVLPGGISGEHLASKARDLCPELRVLYATGYTDTLAELAHHSNVLFKPFKKAVLANRVHDALNRGHSAVKQTD